MKLEAKRHQAAYEIHSLLLECLPKALLQRMSDQTAMDALSYELLRLHVMNQALQPLEGNPPGEVKNREVSDLFGTDDKFEAIVRHLKLINVPPNKIAEFAAIRDIVNTHANRLRKEITSEIINIDANGILPDCPTVPDEVEPKRASRFSPALFAYRWSILVSYATGISWRQALIAHGDFVQSAKEYMKDHPRLWKRRFAKIVGSFPALESGSCLPNTKRNKATTSKQRDLTVLTRPWALEFMHSDYVELIDWRKLNKKKLNAKDTFITDFIVNHLGAHIIKARVLKKWSWKHPEWQECLKENRNLPTFGRDATQPFEYRNVAHQFNYLPAPNLERGAEWQAHLPL